MNDTAAGVKNRSCALSAIDQPRMRGLRAEMKVLRAEWAKKLQAKSAARH